MSYIPEIPIPSSLEDGVRYVEIPVDEYIDQFGVEEFEENYLSSLAPVAFEPREPAEEGTCIVRFEEAHNVHTWAEYHYEVVEREGGNELEDYQSSWMRGDSLYQPESYEKTKTETLEAVPREEMPKNGGMSGYRTEGHPLQEFTVEELDSKKEVVLSNVGSVFMDSKEVCETTYYRETIESLLTERVQKADEA